MKITSYTNIKTFRFTQKYVIWFGYVLARVTVMCRSFLPMDKLPLEIQSDRLDGFVTDFS